MTELEQNSLVVNQKIFLCVFNEPSCFRPGEPVCNSHVEPRYFQRLSPDNDWLVCVSYHKVREGKKLVPFNNLFQVNRDSCFLKFYECKEYIKKLHDERLALLTSNVKKYTHFISQGYQGSFKIIE